MVTKLQCYVSIYTTSLSMCNVVVMICFSVTHSLDIKSHKVMLNNYMIIIFYNILKTGETIRLKGR